MTVRTRFAPSPTGYLHVGGARTALFCWLYARRYAGQFVLRIEDTDRERSTDAAVQAILEGMSWLGLDADEGPFYQTRRFDRYREHVQRLLDEDKAYHCYCTREELDAMREAQRARGEKPRYDGRCRDRVEPRPGVDPVVRFKSPIGGQVVVHDQVQGDVTFSNDELDDLVIARPDGTPTYNFTVVVDDIEMRISHVIRGDDHLNNTPRQIHMFEAFGAPLPVFAHVPMIHGADGKKLSKRHGAVAVTQFREEGYLPDALINYLARLGWSHGDQEIFSRAELVELFDIVDVNKGPSMFDYDKLGWVNQHYIKTAPAPLIGNELCHQLRARGLEDTDPAFAAQVADALRERARTLTEMADKSLFAFREPQGFEPKAVKKHVKSQSTALLRSLRERLSELPHWADEPLAAAVEQTAEAGGVKLGEVAQPLRIALTGSAASPGIGETLRLVGRERTLERIERAIAAFENDTSKA
ncbi:MAG: glutamate--tRNA ligase [Gammaproteobacteria bacterium]|nr:glutamate--tRNA ligase [Gammaproteobacteria bacterium]